MGIENLFAPPKPRLSFKDSAETIVVNPSSGESSSTLSASPESPTTVKKRYLDKENEAPQTPSMKRVKANTPNRPSIKSPVTPLCRAGSTQKKKYVKLSSTAGTCPGKFSLGEH